MLMHRLVCTLVAALISILKPMYLSHMLFLSLIHKLLHTHLIDKESPYYSLQPWSKQR